MKIGIISINAHTKVLNFASPLHSYAFQQFLKMHGYDSVIIVINQTIMDNITETPTVLPVVSSDEK